MAEKYDREINKGDSISTDLTYFTLWESAHYRSLGLELQIFVISRLPWIRYWVWLSKAGLAEGLSWSYKQRANCFIPCGSWQDWVPLRQWEGEPEFYSSLVGGDIFWFCPSWCSLKSTCLHQNGQVRGSRGWQDRNHCLFVTRPQKWHPVSFAAFCSLQVSRWVQRTLEGTGVQCRSSRSRRLETSGRLLWQLGGGKFFYRLLRK